RDHVVLTGCQVPQVRRLAVVEVPVHPVVHHVALDTLDRHTGERTTDAHVLAVPVDLAAGLRDRDRRGHRSRLRALGLVDGHTEDAEAVGVDTPAVTRLHDVPVARTGCHAVGARC